MRHLGLKCCFFDKTQLSQFLADFYAWGMKKVLFFKGIPFLIIFFEFVCFPRRYGGFKIFWSKKNSKNPQIKKNQNCLCSFCKWSYRDIMHQKEAYTRKHPCKNFCDHGHCFGTLIEHIMQEIELRFRKFQKCTKFGSR